MKIGDKIICINNCYDNYLKYKILFLTLNKYYTIVDIQCYGNLSVFTIKTDDNIYNHYVINDENDTLYYKRFFMTLKKLRKDKLNKLNSL